MASRLYTIRTLLEEFEALTESTVRRAVSAGLLEAHQLTGPNSQLWFTDQAVDRWLELTRVSVTEQEEIRHWATGSNDTDFSFDY